MIKTFIELTKTKNCTTCKNSSLLYRVDGRKEYMCNKKLCCFRKGLPKRCIEWKER